MIEPVPCPGRRSLTAEAVKAKAVALGFDLCGIAPAEAFEELAFLRTWLDRGYGGRMTYLNRTAARRADVRQVLPTARSVIVAAALYHVDRPYSTELTDAGEARIARYARGRDYHEVLRARLEGLLSWMRAESAVPFDARIYVDTGPVQERVYARHAGIGWIGKNTCVINPELGSWLLLSEILTSLPLDPDDPPVDGCGECTLCLEACPTQALMAAGTLDARRCLSYLTIELKGAVPPAQRDDIGAHVFGCDICQEVCPYNHRPVATVRAEWQPRPALDRPQLMELWRLSDDELRRLVEGSALERAGIAGLRRNLAIALGNAGLDPRAAAPVTGVDRSSIDDPVVAEHVEWAARKAAALRVEQSC
jgi:epoxyqueuosine reductase